MQKRDDLYLWRKGNTQSLDLCVPTFDAFVKINGAKANSLGRLFGRLSFLYVGVSSYCNKAVDLRFMT
jgi:hypothetical protein